MLQPTAKIELFKEDMKFSAAHFTIFSSTERENLHGHNFYLHASFTTSHHAEGLVFDYRFYKTRLRQLCASIDEITILPGASPHLVIDENGTHYEALFNQEKLVFLKRDVIVLPIANVTVESLSSWFVKQLTTDSEHLLKNNISAIHIKISSAPGQSGESIWEKQYA